MAHGLARLLGQKVSTTPRNAKYKKAHSNTEWAFIQNSCSIWHRLCEGQNQPTESKHVFRLMLVR
jgi:hypothetical protein